MKLSYLGIMKAKEHQFNRKGIYTVEDLVRFLPRKYNDFSRETGILPEDQTSCLIATVTRVNSYHNGTPMMIAFCTIQPTGEKLLVKWFRQNYMLNKISACVGRDVYICAKLVYDEKYKNYSATMPELFEPKISEGKRILPVYPKIPGMSAEYLTEKMQVAVGIPEATSETCPYDLVAEEKLLPIQKALYYLHFPKTMEQIQQDARYPLVVTDVFHQELRRNMLERKLNLVTNDYSFAGKLVADFFHERNHRSVLYIDNPLSMLSHRFPDYFQKLGIAFAPEHNFDTKEIEPLLVERIRRFKVTGIFSEGGLPAYQKIVRILMTLPPAERPELIVRKTEESVSFLRKAGRELRIPAMVSTDYAKLGRAAAQQIVECLKSGGSVHPEVLPATAIEPLPSR